ncbi:hypothetical protein WMY93_007271 [Mugilogobius chulae]|uniref:Protein FAM161A n=1 Tax=Mugilogobius chulae TaxID=88201 RepID=A0AAW0PPU2_9GOBI
MATLHRSISLGNKEMMALYKDENKHCSQDCEEPYADNNNEAKGRGNIRSSVSLEIYGLQRQQHNQQICISNQEYYRRLEELKSAHLRNIAELEKMYISQAVERYNREGEGVTRNLQSRRLFRDGPVRRLQRINSQEELDFHDTSSGSDQSEICDEERKDDVKVKKSQRTTGKDCSYGRVEEPKKQKSFWVQSKNPKSKVLTLTGIKPKAKSKVTIPKPFHMMLREEERKRHKVRTRSEVEMENSLLKRELEELRECKKQFRAAPAPVTFTCPSMMCSLRGSANDPLLWADLTKPSRILTLQNHLNFWSERGGRERRGLWQSWEICAPEKKHTGSKPDPCPDRCTAQNAALPEDLCLSLWSGKLLRATVTPTLTWRQSQSRQKAHHRTEKSQQNIILQTGEETD